MKGRETEEPQEADRENDAVHTHYLALQMPRMVRIGPRQSQKPRTQPVSPTREAGIQTLEPLKLSARRKLELEVQYSQDPAPDTLMKNAIIPLTLSTVYTEIFLCGCSLSTRLTDKKDYSCK